MKVKAVLLFIFINILIIHGSLLGQNFLQLDSNTVLKPHQRTLFSKIRARESTSKLKILKVSNPDRIKSSSTFEITLLDGKNIKFDNQKVESNDSSFVWYGQNDKENNIILVVRGNNVTGSMIINNKRYKIEPLGEGMHALVDFDQSSLPPEHPTTNPDGCMDFSNDNLSKHINNGALQKTLSTSEIDVLVAYTPSASSASGDITGLIQLAVSEANQSYINSDVNIHLNLVSTVAVNYTETGNYNTDLNRFQTNGDGYMDEVHMYRQAYGADVCVLILNNAAYCGLAATISASPSSAFCAVHYDCATGYYSFAHEIGHLQGARHDYTSDPTESGYNHGYADLVHGWRTIMAYPAGNTVRIQYWSNPNKYYNGYVMGTTTRENNARTLNESANSVSTFFYRPTSAGTLARSENWYLTHDLTGDVYVPSGTSLTIKSNATINFNGYSVKSTGGSISIESGSNVPCAMVKQSSGSILALYPTIQAACNNAASGQTVVLQTRTYNESVSLSSKSSISISGYGATVNGNLTLTNSSYCNISGLHLNSGYQFSVNGGTNNYITDSQSDKSTGALHIYNSTYCEALNFTATNGDPNEFAVNIYGSTGDIYNNSTIEGYACGVYADYNTRFNVNNDYFCHNGYDADAENGGYIRLGLNTYSRINPTSVYGNCFLDDTPTQSCSNSMLAKATTNTQENSSSLNSSDNKMEQMYLELINKISKDELKDYSQLKDKYKPEYDKLIDILKGSLSTANSMSQQDKTLSLLSHCYKWLNEKETFYSIVDGLFNNKSFASNTSRLKKYTIDKYIDFKDYKGAVETADAIIKGNSTDQNLTCEMLYEKGIISKFYLNDNSSAYRAFSQIIDNYPKNNLAKFAKGQIDNLPKDADKNYLKSTSNNSNEFKCSNYPNPFNPITKFTFSIPQDGYTELRIYNSLGQEVKTLVSENLNAGKYSFEWNATSFSSGIYFYTLKCGNQISSNKLILMK